MYDLLFEYLRSILYDPGKSTIDMDALDEDAKNLAMGLTYLSECLKEMRDFSKKLSLGYLDIHDMPQLDNPITGELKALHSSLSHLVWQAQQVTKGNYSQSLDFMGDISEIFNIMSLQLNQRERQLRNENQIVRDKNEELTKWQNLLIRITEQMTDWIVVVDDKQEFQYINSACRKVVEGNDKLIAQFESKLCNQPPKDVTESVTNEISVNMDNSMLPRYYSVTSQRINWNNKVCSLHILTDITKSRELEFLAHRDNLTGRYNRLYAMETISQLIKNKIKFQLGFIDIDLLKYVNDTYGHEEGNIYIISISEALNAIPDPKHICRIGGDEFIVITESEISLEVSLESIRTNLVNTPFKYERSFSYGVSDNNSLNKNDATILHEADIKMYEYKCRYKKQRMN